jgi:YgiT-type zinc finger domain-containing protein
MICSICRQGETNPGTTTVTLERGALTFVAKDVPAMVCANCGDEYLDSSTTEQVLRMAEEAASSGVRVDIRAFRAA